jgi:hypothetical protein
MAALEGTVVQQVIFLNLHWGRMYVFTAPAGGSTTWTARARFGEHDELQAESAGELLLSVRAHYKAEKFPGRER